MPLPEEPLSIVEQWKLKSFEMSSQSNDIIASLLTKEIDTLALVLNKKSDPNQIQRVLAYLEYERSVSLQLDELKNDVVRTLVYGLIESLHFTLSELNKEMNQVKECGEMFTQTEEIPNLFEIPKEEPFDESKIKIEDFWGDDLGIKKEEMPNDAMYFAGDRCDVTSNVDTDLTGMSAVNVSDSESLDNSHKDSPPLTKKSKTDSWKTKIKSSLDGIGKMDGSARSQRNSRKINCTECEFQTTYPTALVPHLRYKHSTTLVLAGLALRCDCGVEFRSSHHKCDISNFTLVRKRLGPIQTFADVKTTPQCFLCEMYPKTAVAYVAHLHRHHNSLLSDHGVFVQCSCGTKYHKDHNPDVEHPFECSRRQYSLHKVADM